MNLAEVFIAFGAGLVSFFAPCVVPLLPAYIGYVTGVSLQELQEKGSKPFLKKIAVSSIFYILGFSIIFVILGTAAAGLGTIFRRHALLIQRIGGFIILIFGLEFSGILNLRFLARERSLKLPDSINKFHNLRSFLIGVVFAFTWTPCVGAVLGSILALAAVSGTAARGAFLLFVYSLGISVPFFVLSVSLGFAQKLVKKISKNINVVSKVAGIILAILGLLLLTDTYKYVNLWLFKLAYLFGYKIN